MAIFSYHFSLHARHIYAPIKQEISYVRHRKAESKLVSILIYARFHVFLFNVKLNAPPNWQYTQLCTVIMTTVGGEKKISKNGRFAISARNLQLQWRHRNWHFCLFAQATPLVLHHACHQKVEFIHPIMMAKLHSCATATPATNPGVVSYVNMTETSTKLHTRKHSENSSHTATSSFDSNLAPRISRMLARAYL